MDRERCRFILSAYRPDGADASDPAFAEALACARADPELAAWLARQRTIDRAIVDTLREVRPPPDLRGQILAGALLPGARRGRLPWRTILAGLAAAASVALAILTLWPPGRAPRPFESIVDAATAASHGSILLSFYSESAADLADWLGRESAPVPGRLPGALAAVPAIGCRTYSWKGVGASLVCFRGRALGRDAAGNPVDAVLHLYTVDQASCSGGAASPVPMVFARDGRAVATWRDKEHFYVLVAGVPEAALRRFLVPEPAVIAALPTAPAEDPARPGLRRAPGARAVVRARSRWSGQPAATDLSFPRHAG